MQRTIRKLIFGIVLIGFLLAIGSIGYHFIEKWSWFEAFYMSMIVLTTIGFQEIHPLSTTGRIFTIGYALSGIIAFVGTLSLIGAEIIESYLSIDNRRKRMLKELFTIHQHYIVCGCGKVGKHVIETLLQEKKRFVGIDIDPKVFDQIRQEFSLDKSWLLEGDATDEEILLQAGIERASAIFCCVRDDIKNIFIAMTAKQLNPNIKIAAYVIDDKNIRKFQMIGVDEIISGDFLIGKHLASSLLNKHFLSFVGDLEQDTEEKVFVGDVVIEPESHLIGKTLKDAEIYTKTGLLVFSIKRGERVIYNPNPASFFLEAGDRLIVFGDEKSIKTLDRYINGG